MRRYAVMAVLDMEGTSYRVIDTFDGYRNLCETAHKYDAIYIAMAINQYETEES